MCLACEEMDLYFAYRQQVEAAKKAASATAPQVKPRAAPVLGEPAIASPDLVGEDPTPR